MELAWPRSFCAACLPRLSVVAAGLPASALLLATLMVIGFGSLGQFPNYYAFTQELSARRMGNITGVLSFLTWMVHALVQDPIGALARPHPPVWAGHAAGRSDAHCRTSRRRSTLESMVAEFRAKSDSIKI